MTEGTGKSGKFASIPTSTLLIALALNVRQVINGDDLARQCDQQREGLDKPIGVIRIEQRSPAMDELFPVGSKQVIHLDRIIATNRTPQLPLYDVSTAGPFHLLLWGYHRGLASLCLGWKDAPVKIVSRYATIEDVDYTKMQILQLRDQEAQRPLGDVDRLVAIRDLRAAGMKQREISRETGIPEATMSKICAVLDLPASFQSLWMDSTGSPRQSLPANIGIFVLYRISRQEDPEYAFAKEFPTTARNHGIGQEQMDMFSGESAGASAPRVPVETPAVVQSASADRGDGDAKLGGDKRPADAGEGRKARRGHPIEIREDGRDDDTEAKDDLHDAKCKALERAVMDAGNFYWLPGALHQMCEKCGHESFWHTETGRCMKWQCECSCLETHSPWSRKPGYPRTKIGVLCRKIHLALQSRDPHEEIAAALFPFMSVATRAPFREHYGFEDAIIENIESARDKQMLAKKPAAKKPAAKKPTAGDDSSNAANEKS